MAKLQIYMASYGPQSQKFLDLAVHSLQAQTFQDFDVLLVSSGDFKPIFPYYKHFHSMERLHYPSAIAKGYDLADKDSEYIFLMNDDVILQKDCLQSMMDIVSIPTVNVMANPMSTCCNGRSYQAMLGYANDKGELTQFTSNKQSYDDVKDHVDDIIHRSLIHSPMFFYTGMIWFFATMMRRKAWETVGGIDTNFQTGFDDRDMCVRAKKAGIPCGIITNAFCLHFSGSSADLHLTEENRKFNADFFLRKHGKTEIDF